jgi:sugar phosphate isomerase/epimerase
MELGVFTPLFNELTFEQMIEKVAGYGIQRVELGAGGNPGSAHLDTAKLLASRDARHELLAKLADKGLAISALSCHNNPISPVKQTAELADTTLKNTIHLAHLLDVPVVNTFSGVSGGNPTDTQVNWPTLPWPDAYSDNYNYQWEKKLIPYWQGINEVAEGEGIKVAIELHGGFLCHTPATMLKLREAAGKAIGCNLDPSHMWWQGIDPVAAIKILGKADCLYHFHAKDTYLDQDNINMYGLTDMQPYGNVATRAWTFRSVGCGHDLKVWSDMISALRMYGYDYVLSIEHEDPLMSTDEGLQRAVTNLQSLMIKDKPVDLWWA